MPQFPLLRNGNWRGPLRSSGKHSTVHETDDPLKGAMAVKVMEENAYGITKQKSQDPGTEQGREGPGGLRWPLRSLGGDTAGIFSGQMSLPPNSLSPNTPKQETHTLGSGVLIYPQEA